MSEFANAASRRSLLIAGAAATLLAALPATRLVARPISTTSLETSKGKTMSYLTLKDGTQIFYKDWGTGQPIVFHHGWPLSGDDWDNQMLFFLATGLPRDRPRPPRPRPLDPDRQRQRHGHLRRRRRRAGGGARPARTRSMSAIRPAAAKWPATSPATAPGPRRQGGADRRRAAGHAQDAQPTPAARRSRCSTASARRSRPTARSSTSMSPSRSLLRLQPAGREGLARA